MKFYCTITVEEDDQGAGTTLARLVTEHLRKQGFRSVANMDPDALRREVGLQPFESTRIRALGQKGLVVVTVAKPRQGVPKGPEFAPKIYVDTPPQPGVPRSEQGATHERVREEKQSRASQAGQEGVQDRPQGQVRSIRRRR